MERKIKIVYEDEAVKVIEKPAGMVATNEGRNTTNTVENWALNNGNQGLERGGVVHRLDKGTSGLMIIAKTKNGLAQLRKQFKARKVNKQYLALVEGDVPIGGEECMPIGRSPYVFGKFGVVWNGKEARTLFKVLCKYTKNGRTYSLLEIDLKTGRTHQIRVHMSYLGWPLIGDRVYGSKAQTLLERPFLHAYHLRFLHPENGNVIELRSGLPKELEDELNTYEKL